jgi:hypothetical protein
MAGDMTNRAAATNKVFMWVAPVVVDKVVDNFQCRQIVAKGWRGLSERGASRPVSVQIVRVWTAQVVMIQ